MCEDVIQKYPGAKFNLEHTKCKTLLSYCLACISNAADGNKSAVGKDTYPSKEWYDMFELKCAGTGKVRISVGDVGTLGIGSEKGGENLIVAGANDQVWNYRQNADCSYTFFTDDEKVLTLSNTNNFQTANAGWKAEVASKDTSGDCNFNVLAV